MVAAAPSGGPEAYYESGSQDGSRFQIFSLSLFNNFLFKYFKYFHFHFSIISLFRPGFKYFHFHFSIISLFRPGVFYVNLNPLESQKKFEAVTLTLHEGNPGHHFQFVFNKQQKDLPRFMANPLFTRWAGIFPPTEDYNPF